MESDLILKSNAFKELEIEIDQLKQEHKDEISVSQSVIEQFNTNLSRKESNGKLCELQLKTEFLLKQNEDLQARLARV